jgi:hypothetical protein
MDGACRDYSRDEKFSILIGRLMKETTFLTGLATASFPRRILLK